MTFYDAVWVWLIVGMILQALNVGLIKDNSIQSNMPSALIVTTFLVVFWPFFVLGIFINRMGDGK